MPIFTPPSPEIPAKKSFFLWPVLWRGALDFFTPPPLSGQAGLDALALSAAVFCL